MLTTNLHSKSPAADLLPSNETLAKIARSSELIRRESSKFGAAEFFAVCLNATNSGNSTLEDLCDELGEITGAPMSRQAMYQRFGRHSVRFFIAVLYHVLSMASGAPLGELRRLAFKRVIVEDSTQLKSHKGNASFLEGHGNQKGATAGCKICFSFDLISGRTVDLALHSATEPDQNLGRDLLEHLGEGDLALRDMGFYGNDIFREIESSGAQWLSRLPSNVRVLRESDGTPIERILRQTKADEVDFRVLAGKGDPLACRLVARRVDQAVLEKRRREAAEEEKRTGKMRGRDQRTRDEWHLMVTSVVDPSVTLEELFALYRLRWNIETLFRSWKQSGRTEVAIGRKSNEFFVQSMIYAAMIRLALSMRARMLAQFSTRMSEHKFFKRFSAWISRCITKADFTPFDPDPRHFKKDSRRSRNGLVMGSPSELFELLFVTP